MKTIIQWIKNNEGATAIEYGLMAAAISLAIIGTVVLFGPELNGVFQAILNAFGLL